MKRIIYLLLVLTFGFELQAQNLYQEGWTFFNENKIDEAREAFEEAGASGKNLEALLSLAIAYNMDQPHEIVHPYFMNYIQKEKSINPYLYSFWYTDMLFPERKLTKSQLKYLTGLLEEGKLNFTNQAFANQTLGRHFTAVHNHKKATEYLQKIGNIVDWQIAGNFENISGSGFDKNYEPIAHPENDFVFTTRNGAPVQWFTITKYLPAVWIDFNNHMYTGNSICFAQTFVNSPKDQEVYAYLGVTGSIKFWINDQLVLSEEEERDVPIDAYKVKVKLNRGFNRILIQIGESVDVDASEFFLRFSDLKDNLINFTVSAEPKSYDKETEYKPEVIQNFAESFFEKLENEDKESFLNKYLLQNIYYKLDKRFEARKVLSQAREMAPNSSFFATHLMIVYQRESAHTLVSKLLEEVKKNDPSNSIALEMLYNEATDKEDWTEAHKIVDQIEEKYGKSENVYEKRISLLFEEEKQKEAFELIFEANKRYPENYTFMYYTYLINTQAYGNLPAGYSILNKYYKKTFNTKVRELMAEHLEGIGNNGGAEKMYLELLELYPYTLDYYLSIANKAKSMEKYSKAITYYQKVLENAPNVGSFYSNMADCYKENGDDDEAKEAYEKAILYEPNDFDTREKYRKLIGLKEVYDYFDEPDLYQIFKKSPNASDYPEDNSLVLLHETQRVVYNTGGTEERQYLLIKVFNKSGVDVWKDYSVGYSGSLNIEKAEVLKKSGDQLKAEVNGNRIVFTDLEEGDAILLIYKVKTSQYGKLLKHFWDVNYFAYEYPIKKQVYSLLVEGEKPFTYKVLHGDIKPTIEKKDEFTKYSWAVEDVESIKKESYRSVLSDIAPILHYTSFPDWDFVDQWYYDISTTKAKTSFEVQEVLANLMKGKENLTDMEKVKIIYNYVVKEIRYSSISFRQSGIVPQKASKTINTRIGDCKDVATLFIALCKEAGVKAQMMLVSTRNNGDDYLPVPSISFNHAISKVWIDGQEYVIELTSDYLPFSTMGVYLKKSTVLDIDNEPGSKTYKLDLPTRQPNKVNRYGTIVITPDGNLEVVRSAVRYGELAASMRSTYRDIGEEKRIKELTNSISGEFTKVKVHSVVFDSALYNTSDSLYYEYKFTVTDPFLGFENKKLLKLPLTDKQQTLDFLNDDRKYPLDLWYMFSEDSRYEKVVLKTPSNYILSSVPKSLHYKSKFGEYWLTFKKVGKDLHITRIMRFDMDLVKPEDFDEFADFYKNVIKADETQIGFNVK